MKQFQQNMLVL